MTCKRCEIPLPPNWGPRKCAFDEAGNFNPSNWNCGTIEALLEKEDANVYGSDESMQYVYCGEDFTTEDRLFGGWIVCTRYKHRGCCSSAVHVGDFWPPVPLTLGVAERVIEARKKA